MGRNPIIFEDVAHYFQQKLDVKTNLLNKVELLKFYGPQNMNEAYIYFKYLIRKKYNKLSEKNILSITEEEEFYDDMSLLFPFKTPLETQDAIEDKKEEQKKAFIGKKILQL